ncbi:YdcF family protein [Tropicimonas marinistellae]|uniref:YdcF family protein n=1 Tax=Tropicimonas marinistellae TaxID=1739787 RepID=UPI00082D1175|nr:YdcF family protein [Tropicimonas marinistellae]
MQNVFFVASKVFWSIAKPESLIAFCLLAACCFLWFRRIWAARVFATLSFLLVAGIGTFPVGQWMLRPLEARYPVAPDLTRVDGIVVLGGGERLPYRGQAQVNEGGERLIETMALALRFPDAKVMFTGGSGAMRNTGRKPAANAKSAELFFLGQGLEPARLLLENRSRNTAENAALGFAVATPGPDETWVLVTSGYHMPRAMRSFQRAGWQNLVPWPVDFLAPYGRSFRWDFSENLNALDTAMKEYIGLFAYEISGR